MTSAVKKYVFTEIDLHFTMILNGKKNIKLKFSNNFYESQFECLILRHAFDIIIGGSQYVDSCFPMKLRM